MTAWLVIFAAAVAGSVQAALIVRTVRRPGLVALFARCGLVAAVLFVAARAGQMPWGVAGWVLGYSLAGVIAHRSLR
jgi:hypothetical protein